MPAKFFKTPADFRKWLEKNHDKETELFVGFYKKESGKPSITWPESIDQALCFGWIDGIRNKLDAIRYTVRFTPRKPNSTWSGINLKKIEEFKKAGLMHPAGLAVHEKRNRAKERTASYERTEPALFPAAFEKKFKADKKAWTYFQDQPPWYRKVATHWVTSAKQEATQQRRLEQLIKDSATGLRVGPLRRKE